MSKELDVISILGKPHTVERIPDAPLQGGSVGAVNYSRQQIVLLEGMAPEYEADTLLHEIIHAIDATISTNLTEHQVHALAGGLFAVFRENPGLADRLLLTGK